MISPKIILDKNLSALLIKEQINATALARALNINKTCVHNYCNGTIPSGVLTIKKISEYFDVPMMTLLYGDTSERLQIALEGKIEGRYVLDIKKISHF